MQAPSPAITSISPSSGSAGTSVTISGSNFGTTASDNTVKFNGTAATVTSAGSNSLVVAAPAGGTTGNVTVATSGGSAQGPVFTYSAAAAPTISSISPTSGIAGTVVTINGSNFKTTTADNTVKFNGVAATVQSATGTTLKVSAPTATTGAVTVTTSAGTANGPNFTYIPAPTITSINPGSGPAGTKVTITGTNFDATATNDTVSFNGVGAAVTSASTTQLVVTSPATGTTGNITVKTAGGTSNGIPFTYTIGPDVYVTSNSPSGKVTVWKNGAATALGFGQPGGVFVNGNDVYVAGGSDPNNNYQAVGWKNGASLNLISATGSSFASSIVVSGADVYVVGDQQAGNTAITSATVWKNGAPTYLTDANTVSDINRNNSNSMVVSGSDVYVAGFYINKDPHSSANAVACYWKDGALNVVPSTSLECRANSVAVSGTDVYVVGYGYFSGQRQAVYWKNGVINYITDGTHYAEAACVCVNGSDVYIAYFEGDNGNTVTKILKNGTLLYTLNTLQQANGMYVTSNGDVYLAGIDSEISNAYYSKNDAVFKIPNSTTPTGISTHGVFVK